MPDQTPQWVVDSRDVPLSVVNEGAAAIAGAAADQMWLVRSDGTILRTGPYEVHADAWGAVGDNVTDDRTALQNAINQASAVGTTNTVPCVLRLAAGKKYAISDFLNPKSYVDIRGYGAQLNRTAGFAANHALFAGATTATQCAIRGVTYIGTGTEQYNQGLINISSVSYWTIEDCTISNVAAGAIQFVDSDHIWVQRNKLLNVTQANQTNAINFINGANGSTNPLKYIWCRDNHVTGVAAIGIAVALTGTATRTDPVADVHITNNTVEATGAGWPIAIEQSGSTVPPNISRIDIAGNTCVGGATGTVGIAVMVNSSAPGNDPLCIADVTLTGNRIDVSANAGGGQGMVIQSSRTTVAGNVIKAGTHDIVLQSHGTAVLNRITVAGNTGKLGTGEHVHLASAASAFDFATCRISSGPRVGSVAVAVPATTVAVAAVAYDRVFYVTAGASACTMTRQDGVAVVVPTGACVPVKVPALQTVTPTYASAPTWVVEGE